MRNCIDVACDKVCDEAQYLVLRTPTLPWRPYPHVMAAGEIGAVTNHHPASGRTKVNAALGYVGVVDDHDHAVARRWTPNRLVLASIVFTGGVILWWFKRSVGALSRRISRLWRRHG